MQAIVRGRLVSIGLLASALAVAGLFSALGIWQLDRADQKRTSFEEFQRRGEAAPIDLNLTAIDADVAVPGYRTVASGRYLGPTILFDNQIHQGRAGYLVYSVFALDSLRQRLLVNRGWIVADADRSRAPVINTPDTSQRLEGRLNQPPAEGLRLQGGDRIERLTNDLWRVQEMDFTSLEASVGEQLLPITMLLDPDVAGGFVRDWIPPGTDESRHIGYAFQWFALALAVVVVSIVLIIQSLKTGRS